jgi:hypothetical protein
MGMEIPLFQGLSLKINDASPSGGNGYPTAHLQKGLLLLDQGQELAEEAVGFGVPVLKRGLQAIFPGGVTLTGQVKDSIWEITARFRLNLVEKISRGGEKDMENRLLYFLKNLSAAMIRSMPVLRGSLTVLSNWLRRMFHWETAYATTGFSTELIVNYRIQPETGMVNVEIDASILPPEITEVALMNEQGARTFDRYQDSSGISLQGGEIGCWDEVKASEAWFESTSRGIAFRLGQVKGTRLYCGRELVGARLAWAGFGYSFKPSIQGFSYAIKVEKHT